MSNIGEFLYVYVLSAALIIGALATGVYLARRGKQRLNASTMACGMAISVSSVLAATGVVLFVSSTHQGPYAKLALFLVPPLALAGVLGATILCVSIALIYIWIARSSLQSAGYRRLPHPLAIGVAMCIVVTAGAFVYGRYLGPQWQLWPYSSLSSSGSVDSVTLNGWLAREKRNDPIISIDKENAPAALVQFDLYSMDSAGNITLRIDPDPQIVGDEIRRSVRFEASSYILTRDGMLERVNEEKVR